MAHDHDQHDQHAHEGLEFEVERGAPGIASIRFSVTADEFERTVRAGLQNMASKTKLKGFRPGKVPAAVLEKQFGADVRRDAVQHFLQHAYSDALQQESLRPAADPHVDLEELVPAPGEGLAHTFDVWLKPDVELGEYKGVSIDGMASEVSDEEVDAALVDFRQQRSRPEPAGDEGLPEDGMAVCAIAFSADGADAPALEREGVRLGPAVAPVGVDAEAFKTQLTGATVGTVVELEATFPDEFPEESLRGAKGSCRIEVKEAFRIVPPEESELLEALELESADEIRPTVHDRIRAAKEQNEEHRIETELLQQLVEAHEIEVAEPLVENQVEAKLAELKTGLAEQGVPEEEHDARIDAEREAAREGALRALRAVYLIEEIARAEEMQVEEGDLRAELETIAARNGVTPDEVVQYYREQGLFSQLALELLERRVRTFLREHADVRPPAS